MGGLIISLKKSTDVTLTKENTVVLGHFDQLHMRSTGIFSDFFYSMSEEDFNQPIKADVGFGIGESQVIYLYDLKSDDNHTLRNITYKSGYNHAVDLDFSQGYKCKYSGRDFQPKFFLVSLLSLSVYADMHFSEIERRQQLFEALEQKITSYLKDSQGVTAMKNGNTYFEIKSCLGTGDVGILWYTDDLEIPALCIEGLRSLKFQNDEMVFITSYSIASLIKRSPGSSISQGEMINLDIHINFKSGIDRVAFWKKLYKSHFEHSVTEAEFRSWIKTRYGNHDATISLPAKYITDELYYYSELAKNDANREDYICFDVRCKQFREYCFQVHTRISIKPLPFCFENNCIVCDIDDEASAEYEHCSGYGGNNNSADELDLDALFGLIKELHSSPVLNRTPHLKEAIVQSYSGLFRAYFSTYNQRWKKDLLKQYEAAMEAIKFQISLTDEANNNQETINIINYILQVLNRMFGHIGQGSRLYFDVPGGGLSYAGSHRRAISAYYGIVKLFIESIYAMKKRSVQRKLIPIIDFSNTSLISSKEFCFLSKDPSTPGRSETESLILITLPYAALYNIPKYIQYLAHELHHYAAPPDRYVRNKILGTFIFSHYLKRILYELISKEGDLGSRVSECELICMQLMFSFVTQNYESIFQIVDRSNEITEASAREYLLSIYRLLKGSDKHEGEMKLYDIFELLYNWANGLVKSGNLFPQSDFNEDNTFFNIRNSIQAQVNELFTNDFDAFSKRLSETGNYTNDLDSIYCSVFGAQEACCDNFMIQTTQLNFFSYFDFIFDYFYAQKIDFPDYSKIEQGDFGIRLGLHLDLFCIRELRTMECTYEEKLPVLHKLIGDWIEHNKALLQARLEEHRDISRIEYRINHADLLKYTYEKYDHMNGHWLLKSGLLDMGNFGYVFNSMFSREGASFCDKAEESFEKLVERFYYIANEYQAIQRAYPDKLGRCRACFDLHVYIIESFNNQKSINELNSSNTLFDKTLVVSDEARRRINYIRHNEEQYVPNHSYVTYNIHDFVSRYNDVTNLLMNKTKTRFLWFRGHDNSIFELSPKLYREVSTRIQSSVDADRIPKYDSCISEIQQVYFDQFIARASSSAELDMNLMMGEIDWISSMQHHGAPTHLLDWSENLLSALYFMLEPIIRFNMNPRDKQIIDRKDESVKNGVSLYIFDPLYYNNLWLDKLKPLDKCEFAKACKISKNMPLPNLSIGRTAQNLSSYILNEPCSCDKTSGGDCSECPLEFPLAILTGQSNRRIRAQFGAFLAFPLKRNISSFVLGYGEEGPVFKNLSFDELQRNWLGWKTHTERPEPFLYKITLKTEKAIMDLASIVNTAGINTYRTYPDLQNIAEFISLTSK